MKQVVAAISMLLLTACRPDYSIELKGVSIRNYAGGYDAGDILVDKKAAALMRRYGEVFLVAKTCDDDSCPEHTVGWANPHETLDVDGYAKMSVDLFNYNLSDNNKENWMRPFNCFKVEAAQGYFGRNGYSAWNCSADVVN